MKTLALAATWVALAAACGGTTAEDQTDAGIPLSDGGAPGGVEAPATCTVSAALQTLPSASGKYQIAVCSNPGTPGRGYNAFTYLVTDASGQTVDGLVLAVQQWMPYMNHGGPTVPTLTAAGNGLYKVTNCVLQMPGTWQLRTSLSGATPDSADPQFNVN